MSSIFLHWTGHLNDTGITFMLFSLNTVIMRGLQTITPPIQNIKHTVYLACVLYPSVCTVQGTLLFYV